MTISLNTSHAAYPYIRAAFPFKEGTGDPVDLVASVHATFGGSPTWTLEGSGYGVTMLAADYIDLGVDPGTAPDVTVVYRGRKTDGSGGDGARWGVDGATANSLFGALLPYSDTNCYLEWVAGFVNFAVSGESFDTSLDTWVWRVNASEQRVWRNGVLKGFLSGAPGTRTTSVSPNLRINRNNVFNGTKQFIDLFAVYSGALSDAVCLSLSSSPGDIFSSNTLLSARASAEASARGAIRTYKALGSHVSAEASARAAIRTYKALYAKIAAEASARGAMPLKPDAFALTVQFDVISPVNSPLTVEFDIIEVPGQTLDPLTVLFDILETNRDALTVTFDVIEGDIVRMRLSDEIQAPVAQVVLA